jgi:hypothetical protein
LKGKLQINLIKQRKVEVSNSVASKYIERMGRDEDKKERKRDRSRSISKDRDNRRNPKVIYFVLQQS